MQLPSLLRLATFLTLTALLAGCGGGPKIPGVVVTGTLIKDGAPFQVPDKHDFVLGFHGTADGQTVSTVANYDSAKGEFKVPGPTGHGLPAGTYHITVRCVPYAGGDEKDIFGRRFLIGPNANKPYTPLSYTVTSDAKQNLVIDLTKKTVITQ